MSKTKPDVVTVSAKGQVTIPSQLREQYDLEEGDQLMVVPTEYGLVFKKIDLPSVEEFEARVREREADVSLDEVVDLVHDHRGVNE